MSTVKPLEGYPKIVDSGYTDRNPRPGVDGKRFVICLSKPFKNGNVISADLREAPSLLVTEEDIEPSYDKIGFLHRVEFAAKHKPDYFYPKKWLEVGTEYIKLDDVIDEYYKTYCSCGTSKKEKLEQIEKLKRSAGFISIYNGDTKEIDSVISDLSGEEYHTN